jgi:hypothetical protein
VCAYFLSGAEALLAGLAFMFICAECLSRRKIENKIQ